MRTPLLSLLLLLGLPAVAAAGDVTTVTLEVTGVVGGAAPTVRAPVVARLAVQREQPLTILAAGPAWFWQPTRCDYRLNVEFARFTCGRTKRVLFPWAAARYAYSAEAEGHVCVRSANGDSLLAALPFSFSWQKPVFYQFPGIDPNAASVQLTADRAAHLEAEVQSALSRELERTVLRALKKARADAS